MKDNEKNKNINIRNQIHDLTYKKKYYNDINSPVNVYLPTP